MTNRKVGEILRSARLEKNFTLEMTSKAVGVSINYISKLEKGENSNPSDEVIVGLAKTLDIDEDFLFKKYGKIPLSAKQMLENHPVLSDMLSHINSDTSLSNDSKEKFLEKAFYWYKKISQED